MSPDPTPLLEVAGVSKTYGHHVALEPSDVTITEGTVHGFLGKNGAGKSTLVGLIAGSVAPTTGRILFRGQDVTSLNLAQRRALGIHLLGQHAEVVPTLSVAENLIMPDYPRRRGLVDRRAMRARAREMLARYNLAFDVDALAGQLPVPDQRRLSIVRTLVEGGSLAMLDEPTTALSQSERSALFDWIRELNAAGQTFVFISHFNNEISAICDECTVLRDGRVVSRGADPRAMTSAEISELVTGAAVEEFERAPERHDEVLIEVDRLAAPGVAEATFTIGAGEIVGLVGLPESGARETARALAGLSPKTGGSVRLAGRSIRLRGVREAVRHGIAYLTDDRIGEGLVEPFTVRESLRMGNWPLGLGPFIDRRRMTGVFDEYRERLALRVSGPDQLVQELSGGNQQKILLGRLLELRPRLVILDEPTLGVDVGTKEEMHRIIDELTDTGVGVILLAYDTDEMVRMVDRVLAFSDGTITRELTGDDLTADNILASLAHTSAADPAA